MDNKNDSRHLPDFLKLDGAVEEENKIRAEHGLKPLKKPKVDFHLEILDKRSFSNERRAE